MAYLQSRSRCNLQRLGGGPSPIATTQPRSPLTQEGEKKSLAGIQKPIWSGADLTGVPLGYLK